MPKKSKIEKCPAENVITVEATSTIQENRKTNKKKKKNKNKKGTAETNDKTVATGANEPSNKQTKRTQSQPSKEQSETSDKKDKAAQVNSSKDVTPKKKIKKNQKPVDDNNLGKTEVDQSKAASNGEPKKKKKKKKNKNKNQAANGKKVATPVNKTIKKSATIRGFDISDDRLKAYGIRNPKKFKNAMIFGNLKKSQT